jgi:hypothetical protein
MPPKVKIPEPCTEGLSYCVVERPAQEMVCKNGRWVREDCASGVCAHNKCTDHEHLTTNESGHEDNVEVAARSPRPETTTETTTNSLTFDPVKCGQCITRCAVVNKDEECRKCFDDYCR